MTGYFLDHLWQSTVFAGLAGLLTLALRRNGAQIRYALWFAASLKFLVPFAVLTALGGAVAGFVMPPVAAPRLFALQPMAQPFSGTHLALPAAAAAGPDWAQIAPPILLSLWAVGFAAVTARWLLRWVRLQRVLRQAALCPQAAPVLVKMAPSLLEPGLVGIWRPVILLPQGITERLSQAEMDAVLAHEICHLRRRDNLLAATHMLVEALFWFHPLVWWLGARLNAERENACDESVLAAGQTPRVYAESILKVCKFYLHSPLDCAAGISGADLKKRMETIMENKFSLRLNMAKKILLAGVATIAIAAPFAIGLVAAPPVLAQALGGKPHDPRTEAALRGQIEGFEKHQPAFAALASGGKYGGQYAMADFVRRNQAAYQQKFDALGALKSITFKGVEYATDYYSVEFANGWTFAGIALTPDGKVGNLELIVRSNLSGPEPGTEAALRRFINGLTEEHYDALNDVLSPELAREMRVQGGWLNEVVPVAFVLGAPKSLTFQNVTADGRDQYEATYEHGRAIWTISPLIGGKIVNFELRISDTQDPKRAMVWNNGAELY